MIKKLSISDLLAGVSLAGLLLPEAVAYSTIAGLPPQAGILAVFAGLSCYALLGASRFAVVSATSASAAVLAVAATSLAGGNMHLRVVFAVGLVLMTGVFFIVGGVLRVGSVSDFIAKPVLRGFAFGLAIIIILKQVANSVGVHPVHGDLPRFTVELLSRIREWNFVAAGVTAVALAVLFLSARVPRVPGAIVVIVLGILAESTWHLSAFGVALVGPISLKLQTPTVPALSYGQWLRVGELSVALALILYAESYSAIRSFAMKHGDRMLPNRDLLALGAANLVSGLIQGMPVGAGFSATAANETCGATSKMAGGFAALAVLGIVLTALPFIALTPEPVLAAVVIHAVSHMLRPSVFHPYFVWHRDRMVIVLALAAVLTLGVLDGLLAAIGVSLFMLLRRLSGSSVTVLGRLGDTHDFVSRSVYPDARPLPGLIILRPDEALFFANADRILTQARHFIEATDIGSRAVILSLEESPDLDGSSVEALQEFSNALNLVGRTLFIARLKPDAREALSRAEFGKLGFSTLTDLSVDDAVRLVGEHLALRSAQAPAASAARL
ncbi:MAG: SulP family inorganic anion transporter [Burkholderiaceae bacterium]